MAENQEKQKNGMAEMIFDVVSVLATACIAVTLAFLFLFRTVGVNGSSMEQTLSTNDRIILTATYGEPKHGDVVVTCQPSKVPGIPDVLVKRVIATEGQVVKFDYTNEKLYVNDVEIEEDYAFYDRKYSYRHGVVEFDPVPEGCVFVMGDNRNHSTDSRDNRVGFIREEYIMGKALFRIAPFGQFKIG